MIPDLLPAISYHAHLCEMLDEWRPSSVHSTHAGVAEPGRRTRLRTWWAERSVGVQIPPPAHMRVIRKREALTARNGHRHGEDDVEDRAGEPRRLRHRD